MTIENKNNIVNNIDCFLYCILKPDEAKKKNISVHEKLSLILGQTDLVLELVNKIERAYNISFQDHEINLNFISHVDVMCQAIQEHL